MPTRSRLGDASSQALGGSHGVRSPRAEPRVPEQDHQVPGVQPSRVPAAGFGVPAQRAQPAASLPQGRSHQESPY